MIEDVLKKIKDIEKTAADNIARAQEEGKKRILDFRLSADNAWEKAGEEAASIKDNMVNSAVTEAEEELKIIEQEYQDTLSDIQRMDEKTDAVAVRIVEDFLKET